MAILHERAIRRMTNAKRERGPPSVDPDLFTGCDPSVAGGSRAEAPHSDRPGNSGGGHVAELPQDPVEAFAPVGARDAETGLERGAVEA